MNSKGIIAVAMSGGVDSSTAALLLKNEGYRVIGITGIMHGNDDTNSAAKKAADICAMLDIEHYSIDLKKEFKNNVIDYFEKSYEKGLTPNPCVVCNKTIKWGALKKYAHETLNADFYATGHYARIIKDGNSYKLSKAKDTRKDQIYMLFDLSQDDLSNTIFPLGDLTKPEVREFAELNGLPCAANKESQDICFIQPPDSTQKYLARKLGEQEGNIVDIKTNKVIGRHKGAFKYTIGQRKGIGVAASEPLYVVNIKLAENIVYVGFLQELYKPELELVNVNWQQEEFSSQEFKALVKIRYNSSAKEAIVIPKQDYSAIVKFIEPQFAITPGQAAVFYDLKDEYLIGGGWIK
jgi:tRNA-specific 2-thiouridylase